MNNTPLQNIKNMNNNNNINNKKIMEKRLNLLFIEGNRQKIDQENIKQSYNKILTLKSVIKFRNIFSIQKTTISSTNRKYML